MTMESRCSQRSWLPAAVLLGAAVALAPVAPAAVAAAPTGGSAAEFAEPLLISHDGQTFTPGSDVDLFAHAGRVVPGDGATESFWVRNDAGEIGDLRLDLVNVEANNLDLARATELLLTDGSDRRLGRTTVAEAIAAGQCTTVASDLTLGPGETVAVIAALSIDPELGSAPGDSGREGALASVDFQLRATLSDARAGAGDPDGCPSPGGQGPSEDLPATGSQFTVPALVLSAVLLAGGLLALLLSRRGRHWRHWRSQG